jgi:hypothetical protein
LEATVPSAIDFIQHLAKFSIWQIWSSSGKIQHLANLVSIWQNSASGKNFGAF